MAGALGTGEKGWTGSRASRSNWRRGERKGCGGFWRGSLCCGRCRAPALQMEHGPCHHTWVAWAPWCGLRSRDGGDPLNGGYGCTNLPFPQFQNANHFWFHAALSGSCQPSRHGRQPPSPLRKVFLHLVPAVAEVDLHVDGHPFAGSDLALPLYSTATLPRGHEWQRKAEPG